MCPLTYLACSNIFTTNHFFLPSLLDYSPFQAKRSSVPLIPAADINSKIKAEPVSCLPSCFEGEGAVRQEFIPRLNPERSVSVQADTEGEGVGGNKRRAQGCSCRIRWGALPQGGELSPASCADTLTYITPTTQICRWLCNAKGKKCLWPEKEEPYCHVLDRRYRIIYTRGRKNRYGS